MTLTTDPTARKTHPITTGVLDYFPDAIAEVANASFVGNEQHHPGAPLHWDKDKSTDEADCLVRHLVQRGTRDTDGVRHTAKVAWRALALLQRELDAETAESACGACKDGWSDSAEHECNDNQAQHPAATSFKEQWTQQSRGNSEYYCK